MEYVVFISTFLYLAFRVCWKASLSLYSNLTWIFLTDVEKSFPTISQYNVPPDFTVHRETISELK